MSSNGKSKKVLPPNHSFVGYRYRAYPTEEQKRLLSRHFGNARVVYNDFIALNSNFLPMIEGEQAIGPVNQTPYTDNFTANKLLTQTKKTSEREWLNNTPNAVLQQSISDAHRAWINYFSSKKGLRKGRAVGRPKFKKRSETQSIRFTETNFGKIPGMGNNGVLKIGKSKAQIKLSGLALNEAGKTIVGILKFNYNRPLPSKPGSATITKESDGRYYISFGAVIRENRTAPATSRAVGIDVGLNHLATLSYSDGGEEKVENPRFLKAKLRKLAKAQKEYSRRQKGSQNQEKSRVKVAAIHRKVRESRNDHHNKLARRIVDENQIIGMETLNVAGMARTRLAKSINDAAFGSLLQKIETQAKQSNRFVHKVGRFYASSQICSACGENGGKKPLHVREWTCTHCGTVHDRDYNAAQNIQVAASRAETLNACGGESSGPVKKLVSKHGETVPVEAGISS